MSFIKFFHDRFATPVEAVPAMKKVKDIVKKAEANITNGKIFPIARSYSLWETDDVIGTELYRNMGLALVCVFLTTLVLLANLSAALMVLLCVLLALLDIGGFMYFWGLTIDTVSCNNLIIAIGLCIDYASHIAHRFLIEPGPDRNSRIRSTLENIGPAVLNGGLTTLFAFILLANSQSHVFLTFFKVFFLVVSFGLYHGLVVLPVFLSLFGPESHVIIQADTNAEQEMNVAGASGQETKNLVKTSEDTEMKEYSDNKTTDQNDAVKNNVH
jgi:predicted RND superfamily exporter protein